MKLIPSAHWQHKRRKRTDITDDLIEHAILHSATINDRRWSGVLNANWLD